MLISFVVPCYNSEKYMRKCVDSLLIEDAEIILVNDGSTDGTADICDEYKEKYENVVVVHKKNGGHGSGINAGLKIARGKYFKVVDSDDWLNKKALRHVMETLKNTDVDMYIANYVYEHTYTNSKKIISYKNVLPENKVFSWNEIGKFRMSQYILMHSVIYKTEILHACNLTLPEHTFYVDNLYVYLPLLKVNKMYYSNINLYRYLIGRDDQSVNEKRMIKLVDNQVLVTKKMIDVEINTDVKHLKKYMRNYLGMMMSISSIFLMLNGSKEADIKRKDLWDYLKKSNYYWSVKYFSIAFFTTFRGSLGKKIALSIYSKARKIYKFN